MIGIQIILYVFHHFIFSMEVQTFTEQLTEKFRRFIDRYYYETLLSNVRKGKTYLQIDYTVLAKFDLDLADKLIDDFQEVKTAAEEAIRQFDLPSSQVPIHARFINLPKSAIVVIRNIRSKHIGKLISTEGLIRQASDVRPKIISATFQCPACAATMLIAQATTKLREPMNCQCGRKGQFKMIDRNMVDVQRLVIEEIPENLEGGEQPKKISVFLEADLLTPDLELKRYPGNTVVVVGVVNEISVPLKTGGQSTTYDLVIDCNSIETQQEDFSNLEVTSEDINTIKDLASKPDIYEKLVDAIAPSIHGYRKIKESIALQLFGGVRKIRDDGTITRGDIHVFIVGDPGSGKSQILKYVSKLAPKARYMAGKGSTAAGLTATVVRDEFMRGWALEAGALVLCNKGIAMLDELDKMNEEDTSAMHEALEQQSITIAKANIHATLRAETSVLAAANPKHGRFDRYNPIPQQIDLPPALINRFDLIFTVQDIPSKENDERIASHILKLAKDSSTVSSKLDVSQKLLRQYIAYAKQNCKPVLSDEAIEDIQKFYVDLRSTAIGLDGEVKPIPISARQLEALIRLSEASAKIRLSAIVTREDSTRAIDLLRASMGEVAFDSETGRFDIDRVATGITASQRSQIAVVERLTDDMMVRLGKIISVQELIKEAMNEGIERDKVEAVLDRLKKRGDIFEPRPGFIQKVG